MGSFCGGAFSAPANDRTGAGSRTAQIPEQVVGPDGAITIPYAGRLQVVGRTPSQVEQSIVTALTGKAIEPQALVTVTKNIANTVTVIGEVTSGARVPLTTRGDRILDVVALAGGTRAPAHETFITLIRNGRAVRIPMQAILLDPNENIYVRPGDTISVARELQTLRGDAARGGRRRRLGQCRPRRPGQPGPGRRAGGRAVRRAGHPGQLRRDQP